MKENQLTITVAESEKGIPPESDFCVQDLSGSSSYPALRLEQYTHIDNPKFKPFIPYEVNGHVMGFVI